MSENQLHPSERNPRQPWVLSAPEAASRDPAVLLGLPKVIVAPTTATPALRRVYEAFLDSLLLCPGNRAILSDPYSFCLDSAELALIQSRRPLPLTLPCLWKTVLSLSFAQPYCREHFTSQQAVDEEGEEFNHGLPTLMTIKAIDRSGDRINGRALANTVPMLTALRDQLSPSRTLATFFGSCSGWCRWQLNEWNDQWAVVYSDSDYYRDEFSPYPLILGFCHRDDLQRGFVDLLTTAPELYGEVLYYICGRIEGTDWPIARFALEGAESGEPRRHSAIELNNLTREQLALFLAGNSNPSEIASRLLEFQDTLGAADLGHLSIRQAWDLCDPHCSWEELREFVEARVPEAEQRRQEQLARRRALLAPFVPHINREVERICGPRRRGGGGGAQWAAIARNARRGGVREFLEDFILKHGEPPVGRFDLGRPNRLTTQRIGTVEFFAPEAGDTCAGDSAPLGDDNA